MKITMDLTHILLVLAAVVCSANAFTKYGRTCKDIGCLPSESCIITSDSCSWSQQEGKECGSYPTCKKMNAVNSSPGASLNPAPDNSRVNPNGHGNNYNPGSYNNNPSNSYGHGIDPNQIFGNPNRQPQANQPWNNLPIFPPNPTSGHGKSPQQPIYPAPQNYPQYPQNPQNNQPGNGANPFQMPFAFGAPPPGSQQNLYPERPPTRQPSLLDQFLYNKQGGRRNSGSTFDNSWRHTSFIVILSISNILVGFILTARY